MSSPEHTLPIKGAMVRSGRRPADHGSGRVCKVSDCDTRLSRYNRNSTCHRHSPVRFPIVRGRPPLQA